MYSKKASHPKLAFFNSEGKSPNANPSCLAGVYPPWIRLAAPANPR
jgi:hypothetical protein